MAEIQYSMKRAIAECIEEGVPAEFLKENGGPVMDILNYTLTEEQKKEGYMECGRVEGRVEEKISIIRNMNVAGFTIDQMIAATSWSRDKIEAVLV